MDVPSVSVGVHGRYTPEFRDRILGKLRQASEAVHNTTYRLLSPPSLRVLGEVASPTAPVVSFYMQLGPERRIGNAWQSVFSSMVVPPCVASAMRDSGGRSKASSIA